MDIKELLDAIRLTCPDCGWSLMLDMSLLHPDRQHVRCPDCGLMFATFVDPAARKARARRYERAGKIYFARRNAQRAGYRRTPHFGAGDWAALKRYERLRSEAANR